MSSCSGTLIGADLFLTAGHCLTDPSGEDGRSASVSFNYATDRDGQRWPDHVTRFFKVSEVVLAPSVASLDDWVILRLDAAPGALPDPLPIRTSPLVEGEVVFSMHHPNGAVKKTQAGRASIAPRDGELVRAVPISVVVRWRRSC